MFNYFKQLNENRSSEVIECKKLALPQQHVFCYFSSVFPQLNTRISISDRCISFHSLSVLIRITFLINQYRNTKCDVKTDTILN